jgi:hypothetical protein
MGGSADGGRAVIVRRDFRLLFALEKGVKTPAQERVRVGDVPPSL